MKPVRQISALIAVCALLAACAQASGSEDERAPSSEDPTQSDEDSTAEGLPGTAPDGSAIPDGTWVKTSTVADAQVLGIPKHVYREFLGADGEERIVLRIDGADYAELQDEGGALTVGDQGTAGYDADGNWVTTSRSEGCPDCRAVFEWTLDGDDLTLTMVDIVTSEDPVDVLVSRLVMEGTYTRP